MKILFTETPQISYSFDLQEHQDTIDEGYASHITSQNNATVLVFKDVEPHIDGNGMSVLWMIQGTGQFFIDGDTIVIKPGDVISFDDCKEHEFISDEFCVAVSFNINKEYKIEDIQQMVTQFNTPQNQAKRKFKK